MNVSRCCPVQSKLNSVAFDQCFPFVHSSSSVGPITIAQSSRPQLCQFYGLIYYSAAVFKYHDQKQLTRKVYFGFQLQRELMTGDDNQSRKLSYHIWTTHRKKRFGSGMRLLTLKVNPSWCTSSSKGPMLKVPHLLKQHHQLGTKCLNSWAKRGISHPKHHIHPDVLVSITSFLY